MTLLDRTTDNGTKLPTLTQLVLELGHTQLQATWWRLEHKFCTRSEAMAFLVGRPLPASIGQSVREQWLNQLYREYVAAQQTHRASQQPQPTPQTTEGE